VPAEIDGPPRSRWNRHCPKCQAQARERWLQARERERRKVNQYAARASSRLLDFNRLLNFRRYVHFAQQVSVGLVRVVYRRFYK
jgi:hypothetical protein